VCVCVCVCVCVYLCTCTHKEHSAHVCMLFPHIGGREVLLLIWTFRAGFELHWGKGRTLLCETKFVLHWIISLTSV